MFPHFASLFLGTHALFVSAQSTTSNSTRDTSTLNTTSFNYYNDIENQTVAEIAARFNRGVCDVGRVNLMADVSIVPYVGQTFIIPGEVCNPDNTTCVIDGPGVNDCLIGSPRNYYTFNGDTYWKIAGRLNMTLNAIMCAGDSCDTNITCIDGICPSSGGSYGANETIPAGQFLKISVCEPSVCDIEPAHDLNPTYNYSYIPNEGGTYPPIALAANCRLLSSNYTVLS